MSAADIGTWPHSRRSLGSPPIWRARATHDENCGLGGGGGPRPAVRRASAQAVRRIGRPAGAGPYPGAPDRPSAHRPSPGGNPSRRPGALRPGRRRAGTTRTRGRWVKPKRLRAPRLGSPGAAPARNGADPRRRAAPHRRGGYRPGARRARYLGRRHRRAAGHRHLEARCGRPHRRHHRPRRPMARPDAPGVPLRRYTGRAPGRPRGGPSTGGPCPGTRADRS